LTSHAEDGGRDVISRKKCCHLVSEHEESAARLCRSVRQFLIYSTFVLVNIDDRAWLFFYYIFVCHLWL